MYEVVFVQGPETCMMDQAMGNDGSTWYSVLACNGICQHTQVIAKDLHIVERCPDFSKTTRW